jgi:two-component system, sensor histidine kinase YesM
MFKWVKIFKSANDLKNITKMMGYYILLLIISILLSNILFEKIYSGITSKKISDLSMQTLYSVNNITSLIKNAGNLSKVIFRIA